MPNPQRFPVAPPLTPEQQATVDRFDRAPAAPEAFRHLAVCQGTADAPGLCECPPAVVDVHAARSRPVARPLVPDFLTGAARYGGGHPVADYLHQKGEGR